MLEDDSSVDFPEDVAETSGGHQVRSLRELIDLATGRGNWDSTPENDSGIVDVLPFPFLALVGQSEMKLALLLSVINSSAGGVLLIGPRGTGKTTAVRSLVNLLPQVPRSLCYYGCMPEDIESGGINAVCPDCVQKYAAGEPLAAMDDVRLVELPLNARLDDVVGGIDERTALHDRFRIRRGILAQADRNILYIDEVNLLSDDIVDVILDAAAQGSYTVRRGPVSATYHSRFTLIGSMNPEEGSLRPQIMDRFGLRVYVKGLYNPEDRFEAYRRVHEYLDVPRKVVEDYRTETELAKHELQEARDLLPQVHLPESVARMGLNLIEQLKIDSLRAEITLFESARAYTAFDHRKEVEVDDIRSVALMALRMRRSKFIEEFSSHQKDEEDELMAIIENTFFTTT
jgi:magnesium chelatase subunit I